jgi:uncharacterized membrane protein
MKSIRKNVISGLIGGTMAVLLMHMGYDFRRWEYWAIGMLAIGFAINLSKE